MLDWISGYRREWLVPDTLAGVALWAVMVPEGMAYAGIVGVPPIIGLYTIVPALLAYALFGTSREAAAIAGYCGKSDALDEAIGTFAMRYAERTEKDYEAFATSARMGRIRAAVGASR
ncbi:SulP family inorganic anion transporter [Bradyrhizobium liaoningense]|uniref:SulP family inorganic anion transporter n=1 Tax=Bradyrhizobium liaoningense TaxID=43992 RepID=UPI002012E763|nr:SulP family inorganic anion transporter [Bradyrhizobium liaoningense]